MSRPALFVTALFYMALGLVWLLTPTHALSITRSTFEKFIRAQLTQQSLGGVVLLAGVLTLAATLNYDMKFLRMMAASLRAGSMGAVLLLVLLVYVFLPGGNLTAVIIFGYLFALTLLTLPPPIEPIDAAIHALQQRHVQDELPATPTQETEG